MSRLTRYRIALAAIPQERWAMIAGWALLLFVLFFPVLKLLYDPVPYALP